MNNILIKQQDQTINPDKPGIFGEYFSRLKVGSMLNKSGISKTKGASLLELFFIVFNLAFIGKNFLEGVVRNKKLVVGKDAVYNFLNSSTYNWRRFTLLLIDLKIKILGALSVVGVLQYAFLPLAFPKSLS